MALPCFCPSATVPIDLPASLAASTKAAGTTGTKILHTITTTTMPTASMLPPQQHQPQTDIAAWHLAVLGATMPALLVTGSSSGPQQQLQIRPINGRPGEYQIVIAALPAPKRAAWWRRKSGKKQRQGAVPTAATAMASDIAPVEPQAIPEQADAAIAPVPSDSPGPLQPKDALPVGLSENHQQGSASAPNPPNVITCNVLFDPDEEAAAQKSQGDEAPRTAVMSAAAVPLSPASCMSRGTVAAAAAAATAVELPVAGKEDAAEGTAAAEPVVVVAQGEGGVVEEKLIRADEELQGGVKGASPDCDADPLTASPTIKAGWPQAGDSKVGAEVEAGSGGNKMETSPQQQQMLQVGEPPSTPKAAIARREEPTGDDDGLGGNGALSPLPMPSALMLAAAGNNSPSAAAPGSSPAPSGGSPAPAGSGKKGGWWKRVSSKVLSNRQSKWNVAVDEAGDPVALPCPPDEMTQQEARGHQAKVHKG